MKNCEEFEQDIYLYDDLSASERVAVDAHIQQCKSCEALLAKVNMHLTLIQEAAKEKPQPQNYSKLTSSIMQAIEKRESPSTRSTFFDKLFVRYAFITASLALILVFLVQQINTNAQIKPVAVSGSVVSLKTSGIVNHLQNRKEPKQERITSLYACVKSGDCNNPLSKTSN